MRSLAMRWFFAIFLSISTMQAIIAEDVIELVTGAKVRGRIVSQDAGEVALEVVVGGKKFTRKYPRDKVRSVMVDGASIELSDDAKVLTRSKKEIQDLIASVGKTLPDWFESTKLSIPSTLDLDWPEPAPKPWDGSKNVGQFIWDRVNPNPNQWRNGVRLMHHIMDEKKEDSRIVRRAMLSLGGMYHHLLVDYPRAAYWLQRAGVDQNPDQNPAAGIQLADCYFHLGSKPMALALVQKMKTGPLHTIKLLGDMGETANAIKLAESFAKNSQPTLCYLYAGDVCRVAGRLDDAEQFYQKALRAADKDTRKNDHAKRDRQRAEASLAAIEFYRLNPRELADGEYVASSLGYEDEVEVSVTLRDGRIQSVKVTKHREKQFYSSISDTPPRIIAKQGVNNVDTVSGATITSEAIINATAKALAQGRK
jgi:uncharacterized protein with FMN-binding domain